MEQLADDRGRLDELAAIYARGSITAREWLTARGELETRIRDIDRRLARLSSNESLTAIAGTGKELRAQWTSLNLGRQTAIVRVLLDHAVIAPGISGSRSLDPDRVQPSWRL